MKKISEEKLLEELRKRVLKKDSDIKLRHDEEDMEEATKEALIEMTELSKKEINDIEKDILHEFNTKQKKSNFQLKIIIISIVIISPFLYYYLIPYQFNNKLVFEENFNDNKNHWFLFGDEKSSSKIENGQYIFKTNIPGNCNWSTMRTKLRNHSKIALKSTWLSGEDYYYGLILEQDRVNYYAFELRKNGTACFILQEDGMNVIFIDNIETGITNIDNILVEQTVLIKGNKLEYYVNDKLVLTEKHSLSPINSVGLRVCGSQTVAFDKLEVWE